MPIKIKKVLIVNPFGIGDVLFTTPLVSSIKAHIPTGYIGYIANARTAPVLNANPKIDRVFVYERDELHALYKRSLAQFWRKSLNFLGEIKKENFDLVLDLSLNGNAGFLLKYAGIPRRVGFDYKGRNPFLTERIPLKGYEGRHVVEYYMELLEKLGIPVSQRHLDITVPEEESRWAEKLLQKHGFGPGTKVIGMVPGGGASWGKDAVYKRWPPEKYAKLADKIIEISKAAIILMGDQKERELCLTVARMMTHKCVVLAGETSVIQLAALSAKCQCVVVNDGGPLHVAVAAGARTVSIFGPVDDAVYGPYPARGHVVVKTDLPCQPCYRRFRRAECDHVSCLKDLTVENVLKGVQQVI